MLSEQSVWCICDEVHSQPVQSSSFSTHNSALWPAYDEPRSEQVLPATRKRHLVNERLCISSATLFRLLGKAFQTGPHVKRIICGGGTPRLLRDATQIICTVHAGDTSISSSYFSLAPSGAHLVSSHATRPRVPFPAGVSMARLRAPMCRLRQSFIYSQPNPRMVIMCTAHSLMYSPTISIDLAKGKKHVLMLHMAQS
jgi:hypothetical protein